jgi:AcrR family transcriptional regulator
MTGPRRYAKGAAKRAEILEVALDLIARCGYRRSTLREIAAAVGLTNAGVLHYFGSREELFTEVLRLRDEADRAVDGGDRLQQFVDVIGHNADVPGLVHLYSSLAAEAVDPEHEAHRFFAAIARCDRTSPTRSIGSPWPDACAAMWTPTGWRACWWRSPTASRRSG